VTDPRLGDVRAAHSLKTRSSEGLFSSRTDLNQVLPLFLITARAEVIRTTADAVEMEGARSHGKVMEADAESSEVHCLNLSFEKIFSLAMRQFEINCCLGSVWLRSSSRRSGHRKAMRSPLRRARIPFSTVARPASTKASVHEIHYWAMIFL